MKRSLWLLFCVFFTALSLALPLGAQTHLPIRAMASTSNALAPTVGSRDLGVLPAAAVADSSPPGETRAARSPRAPSIDEDISTHVVTAAADSYVSQDAPTTNFGAYSGLIVQEMEPGMSAMNSLVVFDTSSMPTTTLVITAYLSLALTASEVGDAALVEVHPLLSAWDEQTVTWDNKPNYGEALAETTVLTNTSRQYFWNISPLVQGWLSAPETNHGLALVVHALAGPVSRQFESREGGSAPRLTLAYELPPSDTPPPERPPLPDHLVATLPLSTTGYLRWDGAGSGQRVFAPPADIQLSFNPIEGYGERFLLGFDFSSLPVGATVYESSLELYLLGGANAAPVHVIANSMLGPWRRESATFAGLFMASNEETDAPRGSLDVPVPPEPGWLSMDVTKVVQRWVSGRRSNYGFQLLGGDGTAEPWSLAFAGAEDPDLAPRLVVKYAPPSARGAVAEAALPSYTSVCPLGVAELFKPYGARQEWAVLSPYKVISGTVTAVEVSHKEWPATHKGHDVMFELLKDATNAWAMSAANPDDIEIEWENYIPPLWAWPKQSDHATIFGPWVADCGHDAKTEIHPPRGWVMERETPADISGRGGYGVVDVKQADIFFSNRRTPAYCGGWCENGAGIPTGPPYVPLNDRDYTFRIYPPNNAASGATLIYWIVPHTYAYGQPVNPVIQQVGSGANAYLKVTLPYKGKSGPLYTGASVYVGWSDTTNDEMYVYKVRLNGINITDKTEGWLMDGGEFHMWVQLQDRWFDLRQYIPAIAEADEEYYAVTSPLEATVIVDPALDSINVRAVGYESDCLDGLYGIVFPPILEAVPYASCYLTSGDNDELQIFNRSFTAAYGYGAGTKTYSANEQTGNDGKYELNLTITQIAKLSRSNRLNAVVGTKTLDGICDMTNEYWGAREESIGNGYVHAGYDKNALYLCVSAISQQYVDQQTVFYLDPGTPSQSVLSQSWAGRADDLRIGFSTYPTDRVFAYKFNPQTHQFSLAVQSGLVTAAKHIDTSTSLMGVEFRIDKSLIPRGPWSSAVASSILTNQGIGLLAAIERQNGTKITSFPDYGYWTDPLSYARMTYDLECPVDVNIKRLSPEWKEVPGSTALFRISYSVPDLAICDLAQATIDVPVYDASNWTPVITCSKLPGSSGVQCGAGGWGVYDTTKAEITWDLPTGIKSGSFTFAAKQNKKCSEWPPLLWSIYASLDTKFKAASVPDESDSDGESLCHWDTDQEQVFVPPDLRQWPGAGNWPRQVLPPWIKLYDPLLRGTTPQVVARLTNMSPIAQQAAVQAMLTPSGVSSPNLAANPALSFWDTGAAYYTVPANSTIEVQIPLSAPAQVASQALRAAGEPLVAAVQVSYPDGYGSPQSSQHPIIPYQPLEPGVDNVVPITVWHTMVEPAALHLSPISHCTGWAVWVEPEVLPAAPAGTQAQVDLHLLPPEDALLGSGCPVDVVAWTDVGELAGEQRMLDLPPVQPPSDRLAFVDPDLWLTPPNPRVGEQARLCANLRNLSAEAREAEVVFERAAAFATNASFHEGQEPLGRVPVALEPAGTSPVCSAPFDWAGDRSFRAVVQQAGYQDLELVRNIAVALLSEPGQPADVTLMVRNPMTTTQSLRLEYSLVGLPDATVEMPDTITVAPGDTVPVLVHVAPGLGGNLALQALAGDAGRVEVLVIAPDETIVGGAWISVWQKPSKLFLPLVQADGP